MAVFFVIAPASTKASSGLSQKLPAELGSYTVVDGPQPVG